ARRGAGGPPRPPRPAAAAPPPPPANAPGGGFVAPPPPPPPPVRIRHAPPQHPPGLLPPRLAHRRAVAAELLGAVDGGLHPQHAGVVVDLDRVAVDRVLQPHRLLKGLDVRVHLQALRQPARAAQEAQPLGGPAGQEG